MAEEDVNVNDEEAENESEIEDETGKVKKKKGKKKLIFILLPILLIFGIIVGLFFSGVLDSLLGSKETEADKVDVLAAKTGFKKSIFYDLPEITVNLNAPRGELQNILKVQISMEIEKQIDVTLIESIMPKIIDNFQVHLRELRAEDLHGAAGLYKLREELLFRINDASKPATVTNIMFKQMLVEPLPKET
ncbi:MAG: flagellar basal body protein FliL [Alphaproteobacteria bacterium]|nr:flagellar basal body protein FliL [Alphaproteobacteria bacterium]